MYVLYYLSQAGPWVDDLVRFQEITNEMMVLLATYPLLYFTPWVQNLDSRLRAGWLVVGCILLNIAFNIFITSFSAVKSFYKKCKFWFIRRKKLKDRRQERERKQAELLQK